MEKKKERKKERKKEKGRQTTFLFWAAGLSVAKALKKNIAKTQ